MKINVKKLFADAVASEGHNLDRLYDIISRDIGKLFEKYPFTYGSRWDYVSYAPNYVPRKLCSRSNLTTQGHNCFHVTSQHCRGATTTYCIYFDNEDKKTKLRIHRIGNCPDSTYGEIE